MRSEKCQSPLGIEPGTCGLHDQCSTAWAIGTKHDSKQKTDTIKQRTHWQRLLQTSSFLAILPSPRGPATVALLQTSSAQRRILIQKSREIGKFKRRKGSQYVRSQKMPVPTANQSQDLWFTWPILYRMSYREQARLQAEDRRHTRTGNDCYRLAGGSWLFSLPFFTLTQWRLMSNFRPTVQ